MVETAVFFFECKYRRETVSPEVALYSYRTHRQNRTLKTLRAVFAEHAKLYAVKFFFCGCHIGLVLVRKNSVRTQYVNAQSRSGERMPHYKIIRKTNLFSYRAHFILVQIPEGFNNKPFFDKLLDSVYAVMVRFNCL